MALRNFARQFLPSFACVLTSGFPLTSSVGLGNRVAFAAAATAANARFRHFHDSRPRHYASKREDMSRRQMIAALPVPDEGTEGERISDISLKEEAGLFPDENTPNRIFDGVRFAELPICNIKATPNNTIISLCDSAGIVQTVHSCGLEGFNNTRKGTNIAAQATAITLATKGLAMGIKTVRVTVRGLGPGRMSAIKGLTMGGMNVVSITDRTPVPWGGFPRPKKRRRL